MRPYPHPQEPCPCGAAAFAECCAPLLAGRAQAQTAEALMRSRFTAYALGELGYLMETWHPEHCPGAEAIEEGLGLTWTRLDIRATLDGGEQDNQGEVEFIAHFKVNGRAAQLHERSRFERRDGQWCYRDGILHESAPKAGPARNGPCPCGSGKKYKRCCAP